MNRGRIIRISALILCAAFCVLSAACGGENAAETRPAGPEWDTLRAVSETSVRYATEFSITQLSEGYEMIEIPATGKLLLVPEGKGKPLNLPDDVTVLYRPVDRIYLAATSAMDFFRVLDGVSAVRLSGTKADDWAIDEAREAMERGEMLFAGKYSAPDFELILSERCDLAIESTMIYHSPAISEKLEDYGIPVLIERSSYEQDPLGRMEWIKVYGAILGKEETAEALFDAEVSEIETIGDMEKSGKTVAFFYVTGAGAVNVRKSEDYVVKMIETAELIDKSPLFREFKAVKTGDVWCTGKNLFQEPMGIGKLIGDFYRVLSGEGTDGLVYLHKLN